MIASNNNRCNPHLIHMMKEQKICRMFRIFLAYSFVVLVFFYQQVIEVIFSTNS